MEPYHFAYSCPYRRIFIQPFRVLKKALEFNTSGLESYALRSNVDFDRYSNVVIDVPSSSASGSGVSQEDVLVGNGLPEISDVDLGMPDGNSTVSVNGGMTKRFKDIFRNAEVPITLNDLPSDTVSISLVMTNMVNTVFKIEYDQSRWLYGIQQHDHYLVRGASYYDELSGGL